MYTSEFFYCFKKSLTLLLQERKILTVLRCVNWMLVSHGCFSVLPRRSQVGTSLSSIFNSLSLKEMHCWMGWLMGPEPWGRWKKLTFYGHRNLPSNLLPELPWELPGGPVVRSLHFLCRGHGFDPWTGSCRLWGVAEHTHRYNMCIFKSCQVLKLLCIIDYNCS